MGCQRKVLTALVSQHAELAAHLWLLRAEAVRAPADNLDTLTTLEGRLAAHLDGLLEAGDGAWPMLSEGLETRAPGELFAAAVFALQRGEAAALDSILAIVAETQVAAAGLISAGGWAPGGLVRPAITPWFASADALRRRLALAICRVRSVDCGRFLEQGLGDADAAVRAEALRTVGTAGRVDLAPRLVEHFTDAEEANRFAAAWSAVRLGNRAGLPLLAGLAVSSSRFAEPALEVAVRAMPISVGQWVRSLVNEPRLDRLAVQGVGMIGDPASIPWLLEVMVRPELARLAGAAFSLITGVDLAAGGLAAEPPQRWLAGPTDDPDDDNVSLDQDRDLCWPNRGALDRWWSAQGGRYTPGVRHLAGRPIDRQTCLQLLRDGFQPQRQAAALELALGEPAIPWFNVAASATAQRAALEPG